MTDAIGINHGTWTRRDPMLPAFRPLSLLRLDPALLSRRMSGKSYLDAINSLNTLQSNAATLAAIRASGVLNNINAIAEMNEFVTRIGLTVCFTSVCILDLMPSIPARRPQCPQCHSHHRYQGQRIDQCFHRLNPPTCKTRDESRYVFRLSILPLFSTNAGLYTSPHLVAVRERIRVDGRPLSEEEFARYFFQVWKKLQDNPVCFFLRPFRPQILDLRAANYSRFSTHAWLLSIPDTDGIPCIQRS